MIRLRHNLKPNEWTQNHMTRVYLIRPGSTCFDQENRISVNLDLPLCPLGVEQVEQLKQHLSGVHMSVLYSSPGLSSQLTSEVIGPVLGLRPKCATDLQNINLGLWQGLCWNDFRERYPKVWRQWLDNPCHVAPPQGESPQTVVQRTHLFLENLFRRHRNETIGLVVPDPLAQILESILRGSDKPQLTSLGQGGTIVIMDLECDSRGRILHQSPQSVRS
jgi:broad specificity phosphatase PhoE